MAFIAVIGGGPVGMRCASLLANQGFEVTVIEEHSKVGRPVQCSGLVSISGINELCLGLNNEDFTVNKVFGARIFSPGGEEFRVKRRSPVALVIDRAKLDQLLCKQALNAGAKVKLNSKLIDYRNGGLFLETNGHGEFQRCKIAIGTEGANSVLRHQLHPEIMGNMFVHALQYRMDGDFDPKNVEVHFGNYAKGFFAWVVPESDSVARVGLGTRLGQNIEKKLKSFLLEKKIEGRVLSKSSGLIPIGPPLKRLSTEGYILAGDAAFQTKATTGGGVILGLAAAEVAAETVTNNLKKHTQLKQYEKKLGAINKELAMHWKIYSYIHSKNAGELDKLFAKAKKAGLEQFLEEHGDMDKPSKFVGKMLAKPSLWRLAPTALGFLLK